MAELTPFTATARLQQGVALDARFGIGLDGLLTSLIRDQNKQHTNTRTGSLLDGGTTTDILTDIDLPLATCPNTPWHWLATTAYPLDWDHQPLPPQPDVHHIRYAHQREIAEQVAYRLPNHVPISSGRHRSRRLPVVVFPAPYIQFRGVGDIPTITTLLNACHSIGSHRRSGEGAILHWEITAHPDQEPHAWGHQHADGTLGRPVPQQCATQHQLEGETGYAGIRPPNWHPTRQHPLILPTYPK